ncbi:MAG: invasion associated locus B family protein [Rhodobacteraceae bacterium]|nr:invasion associated locus B family protein [Paracoccaceae bacterium]
MSDLMKSLVLGLALAFGGAAWAQDENAAAPAGATAEGEAPKGPYLAGNFDDWEMRCQAVPDGEDRCHLYQLLKDSNDNSVAEISIFGLAKGGKAAAGVTIITPLATMLPPGIAMKVDNGKVTRRPFTFCAAIGCFSRFGLAEAEVAAFKRGAKADLQIVPAAAENKTVDLSVSLKGFTAGFDAVNAANGTN